MAGKAPAYREAYPRLDIRDIQAAAIKHRLACRYEDEIGRELGQAFILDPREGGILLGFGLHGPYIEFRAGQVLLGIDHVPDPVNLHRHFFRCPGCGEHKKTLFFTGDWACATCHGLKFRSQLVRSDVRGDERMSERREKLRVLLATGRPHRMRHATFERLVAELDTANEWVASGPLKVASSQHRHKVTGTWMEPKDLPNGLAHGGYYVLGNFIEQDPWFRLPPGQ